MLRTWGVSIATLALAPLVFLLPGGEGTVSNFLAVLFGLVPMSVVLGLSGIFQSDDFPFFLCGLVLVEIGIFFFAWGGFVPRLIDAFKLGLSKGGVDPELLVPASLFSSVSLWVFVVPTMSIGVGINLISSYLSAKNTDA